MVVHEGFDHHVAGGQHLFGLADIASIAQVAIGENVLPQVLHGDDLQADFVGQGKVRAVPLSLHFQCAGG
ncbi:hypothetical protein D3C84_1177080 [compost metagenome]